jgi:hypothetical protein
VARCAPRLISTATAVAVLVAGMAGVVGGGGAVPQPGPTRVFKRMGHYRSPSGRCLAVLVHDEGDRLALGVAGYKARLSEDVTGIAWIAGDRLVFTSSPIYGVPGLFVYVCGEDSARAVVKSRRSDPGYPDGCDYFELVRVGSGGNPELVFRYFADVDSTGPRGVREGGQLMRIRADGRGLRRVR